MNFSIPFYKFHGTGNDFILIDNRMGRVFNPEQIRLWCNRHLGIGADGFILIEDDSAGTDFYMRYFNADGEEASLCGNGSRCAVALAHHLYLIDKDCAFRAFDGIHQATILKQSSYSWQVSLQMNEVTVIQEFDDGYFTDTGSPHFVQFKENLDQFDILQEGKLLRHDARFGEGCNINFIDYKNDVLYVRTYERGVEDETLSCGTGVTASAIILINDQNRPDGLYTVPVVTPGGNLTVKFNKKGDSFQNILLEGPAVFAFSGGIPA